MSECTHGRLQTVQLSRVAQARNCIYPGRDCRIETPNTTHKTFPKTGSLDEETCINISNPVATAPKIQPQLT